MLSFLFKNPIFNNTTYVIVILGIIGAFIVGHWFWSQKKQRDVIQANMKKTAAMMATVIDRPPLVEEPIQLIPANEIYNLAYKNVDCKENELYAPDAPLYSSSDRVNLVAPAINSTQRRVNFLEV